MRRRGFIALPLLLLLGALGAAQAQGPARVVALGGDVTEIVYALGAQDALVGVDATSVWPAQARALPNVGYVRQLATEGILALRPTQVIATHDAGPPLVLEQLRGAGVSLAVLEPNRTPQAIADKVRVIGARLERAEQAEALAVQVEQQAQQLAAKVAAMRARPRVLFLLSAASGLMAAGTDTAADSALTLAGGRNVVTQYGGYKPLSPEALATMAPDIVLVMDNRSEASGARQTVLEIPAIRQTPAGRAGRVEVIDGAALLGFGTRTLSSAQALHARFAAIGAP